MRATAREMKRRDATRRHDGDIGDDDDDDYDDEIGRMRRRPGRRLIITTSTITDG